MEVALDMKKRRASALRGLRVLVRIDEGEYEGHPEIPEATIEDSLTEPGSPELVLLKLDSSIDVDEPGTHRKVPIIYLGVVPIGWTWEQLDSRSQSSQSPLVVQIWHVFGEPSRSGTKERPAMEFVARGRLLRLARPGS
jgi:hypothetical protein